ncbi:hypothetical protein J5N97_019941 [Dioscorea zingiberensis]|uniref:FAR1 domain-containing protein n=1 Tax=Dioscorea zingiberensis TaxID=325984 RepID=A0A9D5CG07_9LILI|nr:hypothetical protein J5N97_019941 [Dioscorea zingiberensis]
MERSFVVVQKESIQLNSQIPEIGKTFSSFDEAYNYYKHYAQGVGFSIRKGTIKRLKDGTIRNRNILCSREGFREENKKNDVRYKRRETRVGCNARVGFTVEDGQWIISDFNPEHNHELVQEDQRYMLRISRKISDAYAFTIDKMDEAGIRPVDAYSYMAKEVGGEQYLGFLPKDCSNFLQNKRNNILEAGDAQRLIDYFKSIQVGVLLFFILYKLILKIT